jgi:hypothetical protein
MAKLLFLSCWKLAKASPRNTNLLWSFTAAPEQDGQELSWPSMSACDILILAEVLISLDLSTAFDRIEPAVYKLESSTLSFTRYEQRITNAT